MSEHDTLPRGHTTLSIIVTPIIAIHDVEGSGNNYVVGSKGVTQIWFRPNAKGYQASVENGRGKTISAALRNLSERLLEGPIHK